MQHFFSCVETGAARDGGHAGLRNVLRNCAVTEKTQGWAALEMYTHTQPRLPRAATTYKKETARVFEASWKRAAVMTQHERGANAGHVLHDADVNSMVNSQRRLALADGDERVRRTPIHRPQPVHEALCRRPLSPIVPAARHKLHRRLPTPQEQPPRPQEQPPRPPEQAARPRVSHC